MTFISQQYFVVHTTDKHSLHTCWVLQKEMKDDTNHQQLRLFFERSWGKREKMNVFFWKVKVWNVCFRSWSVKTSLKNGHYFSILSLFFTHLHRSFLRLSWLHRSQGVLRCLRTGRLHRPGFILRSSRSVRQSLSGPRRGPRRLEKWCTCLWWVLILV